MPTWSLTLLQSPLNRPSGESGVVGALSAATIGQITFSLTDSDVISWTMPVRHYQTATVVPFASDVLLYRQGDEPGAAPVAVQRFRVVGRTVPLAGQVTFSAASYRECLNARIFHDSDQLDWPGSLTGTLEQTEIAWEIIAQEQAKPAGALGIIRGHTPATSVPRAAFVTDVSSNTTPQHFFTIGASVGQEIQSKLAGISGGFEWDVSPDPAHPETGLVFDAWNEGGRGQDSPLVLTEATMSPDATLSQLASDYANVFRGEGGSSTVDGASLPGVVVYVPSSGNPVAEDIPTGRWEKASSSTDLQTTTEVTAWATKQAELAREIDSWTIPLQSGIWGGPVQLWLGDSVHILVRLVTEYDDGSPAGTLLSVDDQLRVLALTVQVGTSGSEAVTLTVNHPKTVFADGPIPTQLAARLARLERRS